MTSPDTARPIDLNSRLPALDGLRGLALLGMLAWHAELEWVRGGFARMTIFFVLAGFLATRSILRAQQTSTARRAFLSFWGRRAQRLLPITLLGVAWAIAVTAWIGGYHARERLTGDSLGALASFMNWRLIVDDQPYGAMFETRSAFQHYWSLSLEEQSFLLLPLLLGLAYLLARRNADGMLVVLALFAVCFGMLPLFVEMSADAAYYGTHVRLGEFLAGAVLAGLLLRFEGARVSPGVSRAVGVAGMAGLVALLTTMAFIGRETAWIYQGGMLAFAIPTMALIAAICLGRPWVSAALAVPPLTALGRWAFSIYVLHWPLYLLLAEWFPTTDRTTLAAMQLASSIAAGAVVHHWVERPLMPASSTRPAASRGDGRRRPVDLIQRWPQPALALGVALLLGVTLLVPLGDEPVDFEAAGDQANAPAVHNPSGGPIVALFGGSNAFMLTSGQQDWTVANGDVGQASGNTIARCGMIADGERRVTDIGGGNPRVEPPPPECLDPEARYADAIARQHIDVAVVVASRVDFGDWSLPGSDGLLDIEDEAFRDHLLGTINRIVDSSLDAGAAAMVFTTHLPAHPRQPPETAEWTTTASDLYSAILDEVASARDDVFIVDLWTWVESLEPAEFEGLMSDNVHPNRDGAIRMWLEVIGPALEAEVLPVLRTGEL